MIELLNTSTGLDEGTQLQSRGRKLMVDFKKLEAGAVTVVVGFHPVTDSVEKLDMLLVMLGVGPVSL